MCRVMAPFTPFLTESMYQNLRHLSSSAEVASVHYLPLPEARRELIDTVIERSVSRMQAIIELGRIVRDRRTMPVKYPLPEVVVIHADPAVLAELEPLTGYVMDELNVRKVTRTGDKNRFGVQLRAEPNHRTLGARLKGDFKAVMADVKVGRLSDKEHMCGFSFGWLRMGTLMSFFKIKIAMKILIVCKE